MLFRYDLQLSFLDNIYEPFESIGGFGVPAIACLEHYRVLKSLALTGPKKRKVPKF